jgi:hypothetical protein
MRCLKAHLGLEKNTVTLVSSPTGHPVRCGGEVLLRLSIFCEFLEERVDAFVEFNLYFPRF